MKSTLTILMLSFLATSCYTQFATIRDEYQDDDSAQDQGGYYNDNNNYQDQQVYAADNAYDDSDSDFYDYNDYNNYNGYDDNYGEPVYINEYHYSTRPYVYRYRFVHYDPWDPFWYDYPYYGGVSISFRFGHRYDPYWVGFYCDPYDYWYDGYYDSWGWCGYPVVRYEPYYYGYYHGYPYWRHGYYGGYYGYNHGRYLSPLHKDKRVFSSSKPSLVPSRPDRSPRLNSGTPGLSDGPELRPVVSRPARPSADRQTSVVDSRSPLKNNEVLNSSAKSRPVGIKESKDRNPVVKPKTLDRSNRESQDVKTRVTDNDLNRRYQRKYYDTNSRVKNELNTARNEAIKDSRRQYPSSERQRSDYNSDRNRDAYNRPVKSRESSEVRSSQRSSNNSNKPEPRYTNPKPEKPSSSNRETQPTYKRREPAKQNYSSPKPVKRSENSSRESRPSYNKPSSSRSSGSSYSAPSISSSVRSAPSRSSSSSHSSGSRSSSGRSSSGRSKRN